MTTTAETTFQPHRVDVHVGAKIRLRRKVLGVSQMKLADGVGLTFQQIQKYERGSNRVSASTLFEIARTLDTPIGYFFDGLEENAGSSDLPESRQMMLESLATTTGGAEIAKLFPQIETRHRRLVLELVQALANRTEPAL